jgi:hypothetical protein
MERKALDITGTMTLDEMLQKFVVYHEDGRYDIRNSVRLFEVSYLRWLIAQEHIYPVILHEMKTFKSLSQGKLVSFVLHALQLQPEKANIDRVMFAIQELARLHKIVPNETNGWMLPSEKKEPQEETQEAERTESGTIQKTDVPTRHAV